MLVPKSFSLKNCLDQKNLVGTKLWSNKIRAAEKPNPKSLLKILPVTAQIFLIWTNVTMKNVASTNVIVTGKSVPNGLRILPLKFGQNQVNNS